MWHMNVFSWIEIYVGQNLFLNAFKIDIFKIDVHKIDV